MNDYLKVLIAILTVVSAALYFFSDNPPTSNPTNSTSTSPTTYVIYFSVYNKFVDENNYYLIDYNKTITKVDQTTYEHARLT
jgi:hypothetical protein